MKRFTENIGPRKRRGYRRRNQRIRPINQSSILRVLAWQRDMERRIAACRHLSTYTRHETADDQQGIHEDCSETRCGMCNHLVGVVA